MKNLKNYFILWKMYLYIKITAHNLQLDFLNILFILYNSIKLLFFIIHLLTKKHFKI